MSRLQPHLQSEALRSLMGAGGTWSEACGQRLRDRRKALGLTLQAIADVADTTVQTVARVETGSIVPRDHLRVALAYAVYSEVSEIWPWPTRDYLHEKAAA